MSSIKSMRETRHLSEQWRWNFSSLTEEFAWQIPIHFTERLPIRFPECVDRSDINIHKERWESWTIISKLFTTSARRSFTQTLKMLFPQGYRFQSGQHMYFASEKILEKRDLRSYYEPTKAVAKKTQEKSRGLEFFLRFLCNCFSWFIIAKITFTSSVRSAYILSTWYTHYLK